MLWNFSGYSIIYTNVGGIRDTLEQNLALKFCRKQNKYISILTETHIKHDQILHIRNNWLGPIFLSPGSSHTKGFIAQLHPGLEGVTEVDTDPKERFVSFKVNLSNTFKVSLSNNRVLCFCAPSRHNTREQLVKGRFFERLQNYMENKCEGNENKIILGDFNITMDKMDRDGGNKTQRLYRCCSKGPGYTGSTIIKNLLTMPKLIT